MSEENKIVSFSALQESLEEHFIAIRNILKVHRHTIMQHEQTILDLRAIPRAKGAPVPVKGKRGR